MIVRPTELHANRLHLSLIFTKYYHNPAKKIKMNGYVAQILKNADKFVLGSLIAKYREA
jgi:hypothetical protein